MNDLMVMAIDLRKAENGLEIRCSIRLSYTPATNYK